jgi:aminoglycoside phosphotransferase (APT) family kinase protein
MKDLEGNGIAAALGPTIGPVRIEGLTRMSGGASRETWSFDAVSPDGTRHELVLRRDPPGRPGEPGAMRREAAAITAAAASGLPVPDVLLVTEDPAAWGTAGMVMRRVAGETIARRILRGEGFGQARRALVAELGQFAAGLHALAPPAGFPAPDPLAGLRDQLGTFAGPPSGQRSAVFERALAWLEASPPPRRGPVLVHGDLRLGNLVVGPQGLAAVLDWELAHGGNPAEDLGWLCVKAWRFGAAHPVAGLGRREELLAAYRAAGGAGIGLEELRWWEVLGTLRWGVICLSQAWAHLSGIYRSVELAAIGRRVCEQEWDLLLLLDPEAAARAAAHRPHPSGAAAAEPAPYGRPTASELLTAVREFLTDQVMTATSGQLAFHARVAANVLGTVARELELGPRPGQDAADGRAGADGDAVADAVAARLAVANPRYFDAA